MLALVPPGLIHHARCPARHRAETRGLPPREPAAAQCCRCLGAGWAPCCEGRPNSMAPGLLAAAVGLNPPRTPGECLLGRSQMHRGAWQLPDPQQQTVPAARGQLRLHQSSRTLRGARAGWRVPWLKAPARCLLEPTSINSASKINLTNS